MQTVHRLVATLTENRLELRKGEWLSTTWTYRRTFTVTGQFWMVLGGGHMTKCICKNPHSCTSQRVNVNLCKQKNETKHRPGRWEIPGRDAGCDN